MTKLPLRWKGGVIADLACLGDCHGDFKSSGETLVATYFLRPILSMAFECLGRSIRRPVV